MMHVENLEALAGALGISLGYLGALRRRGLPAEKGPEGYPIEPAAAWLSANVRRRLEPAGDALALLGERTRKLRTQRKLLELQLEAERAALISAAEARDRERRLLELFRRELRRVEGEVVERFVGRTEREIQAAARSVVRGILTRLSQ